MAKNKDPMAKYSGRWFYDLGGIIARARPEKEDDQPEPDKARALLRYFCDCIKADTVPDARVMHYLANAFQELLEDGKNGDIGKALGINRRSAGNPGTTASRQKESKRLTPDAGEELRQEVIKRLHNKETHAAIKSELSAMFDTGSVTVRNVIRSVKRGESAG